MCIDRTKPMRGVISDWSKAGECISGRSVFQTNGQAAGAKAANSVLEGRYMHTSAVVEIHDFGPVKIAETLNSLYVLLPDLGNDLRVLGSALKKFAPDLAAELVKRHTDANSALDDLLEVLSDPPSSPECDE